MKLIKFKAIQLDGNGWIFGDLVQWKSRNKAAILPQEGDQWRNPYDFEVMPETVCQAIGMKDDNLVDIFEGDTVRVDCSGVGGAFDDGIYKVAYFLPDCAFYLQTLDEQKVIRFNECYFYQVIGNIHDSKIVKP